MSWHVRRITRSETPAIQALEGLFVAVPFFLLLFASTFFLMSQADASSFSAPLTRIDALYMTITTFSTVGFGDLTPRTETARAVVSGQMVLNLIVLGLGVRIIATAVQRGRDRRVDEEGRPPSGG
jgi:voltage-gated potassium channel Kch